MAALNFPNSPSVGDKYPTPSIVGIPTYTWDGEKWSTLGNTFATGAPPGTTNPVMDGTASPGVSTSYAREDHIHPKDTAKLDKAGGTMTGVLTLAADPAAAMQPATKQYVDTNKMQLTAQQTIVNGFRFTIYQMGNITGGTVTPDAYNGNYQFYFNKGAHTIAAPANDCAIDILIQNDTGAGAISFTGYTVGPNKGDALTTIVGHFFIISIRRMAALSTYVIKALQ